MMIRGSVSQQLRNGFIETSGKNSIYRKAGSQLVEKIPVSLRYWYVKHLNGLGLRLRVGILE